MSSTPTPTTAAPDPVRLADAIIVAECGSYGAASRDYKHGVEAGVRHTIDAMQEAMSAQGGGKPVAYLRSITEGSSTIVDVQFDDIDEEDRGAGWTSTPLYARPALEVKDAAEAKRPEDMSEDELIATLKPLSPAGLVKPTTPAPAASDELVASYWVVDGGPYDAQIFLDDETADAWARTSGGHASPVYEQGIVIALQVARKADAAEMERKDARIAELEREREHYVKCWQRREKEHDEAEARATAAEAERDARKLTVFDWAFHSGGHLCYAGTPERAEKLAKEGIRLTPVYTIDEPDTRAALRPEAKGGRDGE